MTMKRVMFAWCMLTAAAIARTDGLSILIIGDTNTENGYISMALADTLQRYFGVSSMGTGYIPLNSAFYEIRNNLIPGPAIKNAAASIPETAAFAFSFLANRTNCLDCEST